MSTIAATRATARAKSEITPEELLEMPDGGHYEQNVLPGFRCKVDDLFPQPPESAGPGNAKSEDPGAAAKG
jgi:hypothetical protein